MKTVNLLKKTIYLLLTIVISLNFTSCSQEDEPIKIKEDPEEIKLTPGQEHNLVLDRTLKRMKEIKSTRNGLANPFTSPIAIACAEVKDYVSEQYQEISLKDLDQAILVLADDGIDLSEEQVIISQSRQPNLSDLIDMNNYSYADKLIIQLLENTLNKDYNSVEQQIADINLLKGISSTEDVNRSIDIIASSLAYWNENLEEWIEVITDNTGVTRASGPQPSAKELALTDAAGGLGGAFKGAIGGSFLGPAGTVLGSAGGALAGACISSAVSGIIQTYKWLDYILIRDKVYYYDGKNEYTSKQIKTSVRDDYVTIVWED